MPPVLTSVSPSSGPPGTAIICLGSGFDSGAQVGCPALVATTFISATELHATIPSDLTGPQGGTMTLSVYVQNSDSSLSGILPFTLRFPYPVSSLQSWTTVDAVAAEVPGFKRGGRIGDPTIEQWMRSVAQSIGGAMLRRGLSLKSSDWAQPDPSSLQPTPAGVLELINRLGAAAQLAAAIAADFTSGEWGLAKRLEARYQTEFQALAGGGYDKLFSPSYAVTEEIGPQFGGGNVTDDEGDVDPKFRKDQKF
jgi:IPT/TIG domain